MMTREKDKPREQVMLIKIQLIQCLFGIRSMRQTIKDIEVNIAYRWFLGLSLMDPVPHFTTFGKNYTRRFKDTDLYEQIFARVLEDCRNCPYRAQCTLSKNHQKLVSRLRRVKHFPEGDQHLLRHTVICKNTDFRHRCYGKDTGLPDLNQRLTHGCGQSSAFILINRYFYLIPGLRAYRLFRKRKKDAFSVRCLKEGAVFTVLLYHKFQMLSAKILF